MKCKKLDYGELEHLIVWYKHRVDVYEEEINKLNKEIQHYKDRVTTLNLQIMKMERQCRYCYNYYTNHYDDCTGPCEKCNDGSNWEQLE